MPPYWALNVFHVFIYEAYRPTYPYFELPLRVGIILICLVVAVAFVWVVRATPRRIALFILTLALIPAFSLAAPDVVFGGLRSLVMRYLTPSFLAAQLAVAVLLADGIRAQSVVRYLWRVVLVVLLVGGLAGSVCIINAPSKGIAHTLPDIARAVRHFDQPIVLVSIERTPIYTLLAFSRLMDANTRIRFVSEQEQFGVPHADGDVLLYAPSQQLIQQLIARGERPQNLAHDELYLLAAPN